MENKDDYKLVYSSLHGLLDTICYDGVNSFAPDKISCSEYSLNRPAIQFKSKIEKAYFIYVIEVNRVISNDIIQSWINYSKICTLLYIIVPDEIKANIELVLVKEIFNYSVVPYQIRIDNNNNRTAIINF